MSKELHSESLAKRLSEFYPDQKIYITHRWHDRVLKAADIARKNKTRYYLLRIGFVSLASLTPPAAAAQAAATGGWRILCSGVTVAFSLSVAVFAGLLEITKPGERWCLYQKLRFELEEAGWALAEGRPSLASGGRCGWWRSPKEDEQLRFERFVDKVEHLLSRYGEDYLSKISQISSADREGADARKSPASRRRTDPSA